jgi:hypothetical protein
MKGVQMAACARPAFVIFNVNIKQQQESRMSGRFPPVLSAGISVR